MAGFLFNLKDEQSLIECIEKGIYSTILSKPAGVWMAHHEGTFADYCSMKAGDNVYFFLKRKVYGIGVLVNINGACRFLNYPKSNLPTNPSYSQIQNQLLLDSGEESIKNRFICTFRPSPHFFQNGIDMDEILSSAPERFKILRAFWKVSFIKFSDDENQGFKDIILRRNIEVIYNSSENTVFNTKYLSVHEAIGLKTNNNSYYKLDIGPFLNTINNHNKSIRHEMAIEAALIYQLIHGIHSTIEVFGSWDYLTHQVIASPFKPIDYMDKMDIFGYKYIHGQSPTISNFLVVELKKGQVSPQDVLQLMKYVDWIKNEYAFGDYSMIKSFLVGFEYSAEVHDTLSENITRKFIKGVRPSVSTEWSDVKLIQYRFNEETNLLDFKEVTSSQD